MRASLTAHIYHKVGKAKKVLCGFSDKVPKEWPKGHVWYHIDQQQFVNCKRCLEKAQSMK